MQALNIIDCPVEPHLLPFLMKIKKMLARRPWHACVETCVSHVSTGTLRGRKTMMMMMIIIIIVLSSSKL